MNPEEILLLLCERITEIMSRIYFTSDLDGLKLKTINRVRVIAYRELLFDIIEQYGKDGTSVELRLKVFKEVEKLNSYL